MLNTNPKPNNLTLTAGINNSLLECYDLQNSLSCCNYKNKMWSVEWGFFCWLGFPLPPGCHVGFSLFHQVLSS